MKGSSGLNIIPHTYTQASPASKPVNAPFSNVIVAIVLTAELIHPDSIPPHTRKDLLRMPPHLLRHALLPVPTHQLPRPGRRCLAICSHQVRPAAPVPVAAHGDLNPRWKRRAGVGGGFRGGCGLGGGEGRVARRSDVEDLPVADVEDGDLEEKDEGLEDVFEEVGDGLIVVQYPRVSVSTPSTI